MRATMCLLFGVTLIPAGVWAQEPIRYQISFENRAHHEAEVRVTFAEVGPGPLEVRMSRTSPGRYALHEFAKNVYNFRATGAGGREVEVTRPDNHQWDVSGHGGSVTVTYTLYGDRADGTYTGIDRTHGHLNMPATFVWARGLEARPIDLTVRAPVGSGWRVATQLQPTDDPFRFTAPDLSYFLDSPTEVSDFWERTWDVQAESGPQLIRIALHYDASEDDAEEYAEAVAAIVDASGGIYGDFPDFDFGEYTFLACYLPWVDGDGMEHRNSTVLTRATSIASNVDPVLGTVAHEFFHAWNMERIRAAAIEPFDFEAANMARELWFGEGFTSYFDDLILWRAELISDDEFVRRMGGIANSVVNAPGRQFFSPIGMSMQAPFVDAAVSVDPTNRGNTFLSYYTWGSGIALGLDLTLRTRFDDVTLDDLMREMWRSHGATEIPYTVADIEAALGRITGDVEFARTFFERFVRDSDVPDYETLLAAAGIELEEARPEGAWLGSSVIGFQGSSAILTGTPSLSSPLYAAGLDRGDRIIDLGGRSLTTEDGLRQLLDGRRPGDVLPVRFESRGRTFETELTLTADPALTASIRQSGAFLQSWKRAR